MRIGLIDVDGHRLQDRGLIRIGNGNRAYSLVGYKLIKVNLEEDS